MPDALVIFSKEDAKAQLETAEVFRSFWASEMVNPTSLTFQKIIWIFSSEPRRNVSV